MKDTHQIERVTPGGRPVPTSKAFEELLRVAREYSFEFIRHNPDGTIDADICNHLELSLISAIELGATDADLEKFNEDYIPRWDLEPVPEARRYIDEATWHLYLGDRRYEPEYRDFFATQVANRDTAEVLRAYLPALIDGPAGSAFHAMIRLAYGVLRWDEIEIGLGLAYWSAVVLSFPHIGEIGAPFTDRPEDVLERMRDDPAFRAMPHSGIGLWDRINMMGHELHFSPVVDWLVVGSDTLQRVAYTSLALFADTDDLRALHLVTGCQALRVLMPYLSSENQIRAVRCLWQGACALYGLMEFLEPTPEEKLNEMRHDPSPPWEEIRAAARTSLDEHDLKVVFVMEEEEKAYGDPLYRFASARRMKLV